MTKNNLKTQDYARFINKRYLTSLKEVKNRQK